MTTVKIDHVSVTTQANVYFDGKCVSHGITFADGTQKSVGVILPSTLTFNTAAPEIMECVGGACDGLGGEAPASPVCRNPHAPKCIAVPALRQPCPASR